jgi:hypothetical protein
MHSKEFESVLRTMNVVERARALRAMHQALLIEQFTSSIVARVRKALRSAGHAMTLAYGRGGR